MFLAYTFEFNQHPIVALIFFVFVIGIIIKQSIIRQRLLKTRLMISFLLAFILTFECLFYDDIKNDINLLYPISQYYNLTMDILLGLFFFFSVEVALSRDNFQREILSSLDAKKIFVLVDKKERIKEISSLFAAELGVEKNYCYGKKISTIMDMNLNIYGFNGEEITNQTLWQYYSTYGANSKEGEHKNVELLMQNKKGDDIAFYLVESPVYVMGRYHGRLLIGDKKTEENLVGMEKDLVESTRELETIRLRFAAILEKAEEGISFIDVSNSSIWCNDALVKSLNISGNSLELNDYRSLIHPDDLQLYISKIASLSNNYPSYEITYRFKTGADYSFVKEIGKRIFGNKNIDEICCIVNVIKNNHFERTTISELDNISSEADLLSRALQYQQKNRPYQMVYFRVDSISEINDKFGRNIGNMALSEYVKMIHNNFVNDNQIYRISGLEFVALITDLRKMDVLKRYLEDHEKILHLDSQYGSLNIHIDVYMGISLSTDFQKSVDVFKAAKEAYKFSMKQQIQTSYVYYKDIR